jgi:hypothetical protein
MTPPPTRPPGAETEDDLRWALSRSMEINSDIKHAMNRRHTDDSPGQQPTGFRFRREIDLSNLITIVGMIAALSYQWNAMDRRVTVVEVAQTAQRDAQHDRDIQQDVANKESYERLRESLVVLTRAVEKVADRVERTTK